MSDKIHIGTDAMRQLGIDPVQPLVVLGKEPLKKAVLSPQCPLQIWIDGAAKDNHIAEIGRVAGVGVVYNHPNLPCLYGPVESNMTEKATNNRAELQAAVLGLEQALQHKFINVVLNTDSKLLENIMTKWMDEWKGMNWKKADGQPPKLLDLLKKLDNLRSVMDITWKWLPRNSCPEMVLADSLANMGCKCVIQYMVKELGLNQVFRRTVYDRKMIYPDELPPTVLRSMKKMMIPAGKDVKIACTLDISEQLKQKLIENKSMIKNMTSDQAYGFVTSLRTMDPMEKDGTVEAKCHTIHSAFEVEANGKKELVEPTLVLPKGSVVGLAFSGLFGKNVEQIDPRVTEMMYWTPRDFKMDIVTK